jgi:hypothetical protein
VVKPKTLIIALIVALAGILLARHIFSGEQGKVKKQFHLLSKWVSKNQGESAIKAASRSRRIGSLFANPCTFKTDLYSLSGRYTPAEISGYAAQARVQLASLSLKFYDINVHFPKKTVADATLAMKVVARATTGELYRETHELACVLIKREGRWLFSEVSVVEILRK